MPRTDIEQAHVVAERLQETVKHTEFVNGSFVTIAIGVTGLRAGNTVDGLMQRVDDAQYKAQAHGKDNVQRL